MTYKQGRLAYIEKNRDLIKQTTQKYYQDNKEILNENATKRHYANITDYQKEYYWNEIQGGLIKPRRINERKLLTKLDYDYINKGLNGQKNTKLNTIKHTINKTTQKEQYGD